MKKLLFALALMIAAVAQSVYGASGLRVVPLSGESVIFLFDEQPEMSFDGTTLKITTASEQPISFEMDDVDYVDFVNQSRVTSVAATESGIKVSAVPGQITFSGISSTDQVCVYSLDGRVVMQPSVDSQFVINRGDLPAGIYIVRIGRFTTKIAI
jgi:hypothetical protein